MKLNIIRCFYYTLILITSGMPCPQTLDLSIIFSSVPIVASPVQEFKIKLKSDKSGAILDKKARSELRNFLNHNKDIPNNDLVYAVVEESTYYDKNRSALYRSTQRVLSSLEGTSILGAIIFIQSERRSVIMYNSDHAQCASHDGAFEIDSCGIRPRDEIIKVMKSLRDSAYERQKCNDVLKIIK